MTYDELAKKAINARELAYAPYSNFLVGAALLDINGNVHVGANIENAAYSPTLCAERTAIATAIMTGAKDFTAIAVAGWHNNASTGNAFPCGVCRQVLAEFCHKDFVVLVVEASGKYTAHKFGDILPHRFGPDNLT